MKRPGVMQVTDTLHPGGLERVAVNIANHLPRERYRSHLCVTRSGGALAELVRADVGQLWLQRTGRFDAGAFREIVNYCRGNDIELLHAHGSSLFIAAAATYFAPHPKLVWHDHFGRYATEKRPAATYRLATRRASAVISVNEPLADWARQHLRVPADRVEYVPNFVEEPAPAPLPDNLPGVDGARVVCVANIRPEKDHRTLLQAWQTVVSRLPTAHLLLVGSAGDAQYAARIQELSKAANHVSFLGPRQDVAAILRGCDVGVLSSVSEGLPLALIEYGMAALPAVATGVGQCAEVLDHGMAGICVPPQSPGRLAAALVELLESPIRRWSLGQALRDRVREEYSVGVGIARITAVYDRVLGAGESSWREAA